MYACHDRITGINTRRAIHTFKLCAMANIDSSRAYFSHRQNNQYNPLFDHGLKPGRHIFTSTVTLAIGAFAIVIFLFFLFYRLLFQVSARFTPQVIIGHYNGILIKQHTLQPSIRTNDDTGLLTKPPVNEKNTQVKISNDTRVPTFPPG